MQARQQPNWDVVEEGGIRRLRRTFRFDDFAQALEFTNRVGALAEAANHHPALVTEWGHVTVDWWTHTIGGVGDKDYAMAEKTDALA